MLQKIDDFLVDRVFQPVADLIADWGSTCNRVGMSLAVGMLVMLGARYAVVDSLFLFVATLPVATYFYMQHYRYETRDKEGVVPEDRYHHLFSRTFVTLIIVASYVSKIGSPASVPSVMTLMEALHDAMFLTCIYFLACIRNPPRRRFNRLAQDSI